VDVSGVDGAGPIWHDLMLLSHAVPPPAFVRPDKIVEEEVCAQSGMLPNRECPRTRLERFISGTQPQVADNQFQRLAIDLATGLLATDATPENRRAERVYWLLPPEYHNWMINQGLAIAPVNLQAGADIASARQAASATKDSGPLQLDSPASFMQYQLHPGLSLDSQRLEAGGYTTDGSAWRQLRLVVDGVVIAEAANSGRLSAWWTLALGGHSIWLEGERTPDDETVRSNLVRIHVDPFKTEQITLQTVD
jgi:hypothetical protein